MKLSVTVLNTLTAALAGIGVAGCDVSKNSSGTPTNRNSSEFGVEEISAPTPISNKICLPDGCPACGRG